MSGRVGRSILLLAAAVAVVLLLSVVGLWAAARSGALDAWLTARIAARLDTWLQFSSARALFWPRLAVVLTDVALDPQAGAPTLGAASARSVACRIRLSALLAGRLEIGAFDLDGVRLVLVRGADGTLHVGGLERVAERGPGDGSSSGLLPTLPAVRLRDAAIEVADATDTAATAVHLDVVEAYLRPLADGASVGLDANVEPNGSLRARGTLATIKSIATTPFHLTMQADELAATTVLAMTGPLEGISADGRWRATANISRQTAAPIRADVSLELAGGHLGWNGWAAAAPLRVSADVAWNGSDVAISDGQLDVARLSPPPAAGVPTAEHVQASFLYAAPTLHIERAELRALGGTWHPSGTVTVAAPPRIAAAVEADGIDGAALAALLRDQGIAAVPDVSGALHVTAEADGEPGGSWSGRGLVESSGTLAWEGAQVEGPLRLGADVGVTGSTVTLSNGRAEAGRVALRDIAVDALDASFSYTPPAALELSALHATAFGGAWTYSGTLPTSATAAWRGQVTATGVDAAAVRTLLLADGGSAAGTVDLRGQLAGTGTQATTATLTARLASPRFGWDDIEVTAPADLSGVLRVDPKRLALSRGTARAAGARVAHVTAQDLGAAFAYADRRLEIGAADARVFHGRWRASGTATFDRVPQWNARLEAVRVDLDALLDGLDTPAIDLPRSIGGHADVTVDLRGLGDDQLGGTATVALRTGSFIWDDLRVEAPAQASGAIDVRGDRLRVTGASATAGRAAYGPIAGTDASATFEFVEPRLTFADLHFTACGGTWSHSGWFTLADRGKFAGELHVAKAVPSEVAAMLGTGADVPFATLDVDAVFSGRAVPDWLDTLQGTGSAVMSNGMVRAANVLRPIWEAIVGVGRVSNGMTGPMTRVHEISSSFELRHGRIESTDFALSSDDYDATAVGSIGLDGSLALNARIQLTSQGVQRMILFGSMPLPTGALPSFPPIPARVSGIVGNPIVRPNVSALPASTVGWMVDVLLQTPRSIGEGLAHRLGQVWDGAKRLVGQ